MTTDQTTPDAPRVRADGPGGFHVATAEGKGTPWWRLVGDNGEILGHSEVYASIANAHRGADTAERTVIVNAHRAGPALWDVLREMDAQDAKWGDQSGHPDGTGGHTLPLYNISAGLLTSNARDLAYRARLTTERAATGGDLSWRTILSEEVFEALAEDDPARLRAELVQVAAVATQWVAAIDRRPGGLAQQGGES